MVKRLCTDSIVHTGAAQSNWVATVTVVPPVSTSTWISVVLTPSLSVSPFASPPPLSLTWVPPASTSTSTITSAGAAKASCPPTPPAPAAPPGVGPASGSFADAASAAAWKIQRGRARGVDVSMVSPGTEARRSVLFPLSPTPLSHTLSPPPLSLTSSARYSSSSYSQRSLSTGAR